MFTIFGLSSLFALMISIHCFFACKKATFILNFQFSILNFISPFYFSAFFRLLPWKGFFVGFLAGFFSVSVAVPEASG